MDNEVWIVRMPASLDTDSAEAMLSELDGIINRGVAKLVCDFSRTDYISSIGIGIIMSAYKKIRRSGGELMMSALKPKVRSVFETAGLTNIITIKEAA